MPWKEAVAVELREALVLAMLAGEVSVAELCRRAGVSRKTAYKWQERYRAHGRVGLGDRSRARLTQPDAVSDEVLDAILWARREHPTWGVKKLLPFLTRTQPELALPCLSTANEILRRAGLTRPPKKSRRHLGPHNTSEEAGGPNVTWTIDFKGQFRLGSRELCYPLTVADRFSRYLLCVDAKPGTQLGGVMASMKRLFAAYGLPERIKSDNGSPLAGDGAGAAEPTQRVVHVAGDRGGAHHAGEAGGERAARADAPDAEGGDGVAAGGDDAWAAATL